MRTIVITGCSTGIGLAAARTLKGRGWRVFATARKAEDVERLEKAEGLEAVAMELTDPASIAAGVDEVLRRTGGTLDALYNNAGFGVLGRIIEVVTDTSANRAMRDLVFRPVGLAHAGTTVGGFITYPFALGHDSSGPSPTLRRPFSPSVSVTVGGVGLCMADLLTYARFHMGDGDAHVGHAMDEVGAGRHVAGMARVRPDRQEDRPRADHPGGEAPDGSQHDAARGRSPGRGSRLFVLVVHAAALLVGVRPGGGR